jgi:hypothetical protein
MVRLLALNERTLGSSPSSVANARAVSRVEMSACHAEDRGFESLVERQSLVSTMDSAGGYEPLRCGFESCARGQCSCGAMVSAPV